MQEAEVIDIVDLRDRVSVTYVSSQVQTNFSFPSLILNEFEVISSKIHCVHALLITAWWNSEQKGIT